MNHADKQMWAGYRRERAEYFLKNGFSTLDQNSNLVHLECGRRRARRYARQHTLKAIAGKPVLLSPPA